VAAGLARAEEVLPNATRHKHYGVGFLGIHDGQSENQVFLNLWINENELIHDCWVSTKELPDQLSVPPSDHSSVCVWDLYVQAYERAAWLKHVLDAPAPNIEAYLADQFLGDV
jgi:hypothetical protein